MPEPLSQTQTTQVRAEVERQLAPVIRRLRRAYVILACVVVAATVGAMVGVYFYAKSTSYARTVSCQRGQALSIALGLVVHTAIPPHRKGRTVAEQHQVDAFYRRVRPALKVPTCS